MKASNASIKSKIKQKKRFAFTCEEDDKLRGLVNKYGENNWVLISTKMKKRSSRQCKDRWINYLSPLVVNGTWTPEEEKILNEKVEMYGRKWKFLTSFFIGRTDINIKNHYNFLQNKLKKKVLKKQPKVQENNNKNSFSKIQPTQLYNFTNNHIEDAAEIIINSNVLSKVQAKEEEKSSDCKSIAANNSKKETSEKNYENQLIEDLFDELATDPPGTNEFMIGFYDYFL